jgi:hypothetical protein
VHFFCHGTAGASATIEVETRIDRQTERTAGSLVIEASQLTGLSGLETVWLATLNCCRGAQGGKVNSFAKSLVENGMPAVIAMREAVAVAEAHAFTRAFYESLLTELATDIFPQRNVPSIQVPETFWARTLHGPRQKLVELKAAGRAPSEAAACCPEWTLPVLYVNRAELRLQPRGRARPLPEEDAARYRATLSLLRSSRSLQAYNRAPRSTLDVLDAKIAELETQLYLPAE